MSDRGRGADFVRALATLGAAILAVVGCTARDPAAPELPVLPGCVGAAHFVDDGDGTITDCRTRLMWEKKDANPLGVHFVDYTYPWAGQCEGGFLCQPDQESRDACIHGTGGTFGCFFCADRALGPASAAASGNCTVGTTGTVWRWLYDLNASHFAGHDDWRLPRVGVDLGVPELETIAATPCPQDAPCVAREFDSGCTPGCSATPQPGVPACSCTAGGGLYWSSVTNTSGAGPAITLAWGVAGASGTVLRAPKSTLHQVRAVRCALPAGDRCG